MDHFLKLFSKETFQLLLEETNIYRLDVNKKIANIKKEKVKEVVGILMCMLVVSLPNIRLYWKKDMVIIAVSKMMCWDRFEEIVSALHLSNNHLKPDRGEARCNTLYKVRKLLDMLNKNFKFNTGIEEVVSIDEKIIPNRGTILLKVFKNKPSK